MQFPDDQNGAVLRRMAASGFQFEDHHDVDFVALFEKKEDAGLLAQLLVAEDRLENTLTSVTTDRHEGGRTQLTVVKRMLVTHEGVTAFENHLEDLCARHGGALDGWGVLQEPPQEDAAGPGGARLPAERSAMTSRLDDPHEGFDEAEQRFLDGVRQHGWMHTNALDEDDKPGFSFTTGFAASIAHPELIMFKIDRKVANEVFWVLYRCAANGMPVPRARRTGGVLPDDDAYVFPVARRHYAAYLGWSRWFYRGDDFECLQVVWPDEAGVFPWQEGFDSRFAGAQVDLTERGWRVEALD